MPPEEGKVLNVTLGPLLVNDVPLSPAHLAQKPFCHSNSYTPSPTSQPLVSQPGTTVPAYNPNNLGGRWEEWREEARAPGRDRPRIEKDLQKKSLTFRSDQAPVDHSTIQRSAATTAEATDRAAPSELMQISFIPITIIKDYGASRRKRFMIIIEPPYQHGGRLVSTLYNDERATHFSFV